MVEAQTGALRQANALLSENVRKLAASEDELRRNLSVRDRLMSIITHDILTPLRFIGLIAKLGSDTQSTAAPGQPGQALVDVRSAIDKLLHSTQNMLNWVKYHREGFRPQRATCSPFSIVDQVADDFREMSRFQGNEIINAVPEDDVIRSDAQLLQVILHNLVSNAMKFTTNGKIVIRSQAGPAAYMLEVSDTGKGMAAEQLDAVRTGALGRMDTPADDLAAGNGIGLSLVAELLDALGGRWTIESPEGKGVIVRIFLPVGQG
jgi:signal transduction histidine kinase